MEKCIFLKNCQFNGLKKTGNFLLICRDKNNKDAKNIYRKFLKFQIQMNLKMINPTIKSECKILLHIIIRVLMYSNFKIEVRVSNIK